MTAFAYLLDTNIVADLVKNPGGKAAQKIAQVGPDNICLSAIVAAELRYGAVKKGSDKLARKIENILAIVPVAPFGPPADAEYGRIRNYLATRGQIIGWNDLLIAAHALALGVPLVTNNTRDFSRVPDLIIENWLA